jgi:hypothetical protein
MKKLNRNRAVLYFADKDNFKEASKLLTEAGIEFYYSELPTLYDDSSNEEKQDEDFKKAFEKYLKLTPLKRINNYGAGRSVSKYNVVPHSNLKNYLHRFASFKHNVDINLQNTINRMIESGYIVEIPKDEAKEIYKTKAIIYKLKEYKQSKPDFFEILSALNTKKQELDNSLIPAFDATLVKPYFHSGPIE